MLHVFGKMKLGFHLRNIRFHVKKKKGLKLLNTIGCICSKGSSKNDNNDKKAKKSWKGLVESSPKEEIENGGNDAKLRLPELANKNAASTPAALVEAFEKRAGTPIKSQVTEDVGASGHQPEICRVLSVRNGVDAGQVVAGWPSWLSSVAGEAIKEWVPRKAESFEKLDKIGQGTYSSVYRARDLETRKTVALKKVRFVNMDPESVRFMAREILILRRLDHPNVMKLEGLVTSKVSGNLYLVFEYMEHDLAGLTASSAVKFTEPQIKCYMQQLFRGLEHCHSRGVLHRDIKGSNLLIDNNGNLKIGDFGLATFFRAKKKQPLTSRVVTLWYRPPELLLGATDYGIAVDLWSSGCILAEMFAGKPVMPGRTEVEQLHKIFKLCGSPSEEYWKKSNLPHATIFKPQQPYKRRVAETFKEFPSPALQLLESLLAFEPEYRGSATSALQSEFFSTEPLACDPSSLPKYPHSKEFNAKIRDKEVRRQRAADGKGDEKLESSNRKSSKESKPVPTPNPNGELHVPIQERKAQSNWKSNQEDETPRGAPLHDAHLSSSVAGGRPQVGSLRASESSRNIDTGMQRLYERDVAAARLSRFSNSVAACNGSRLDCSREASSHLKWQDESFGTRKNNLNDGESSHGWLGRLNYSYKKDGQGPRKETTIGHALTNSRIHYSGPLLPPGGSMEEMLKEHERRIQIAIRKARVDKTKTKKGHSENGQVESLLQYVNSRR